MLLSTNAIVLTKYVKKLSYFLFVIMLGHKVGECSDNNTPYYKQSYHHKPTPSECQFRPDIIAVRTNNNGTKVSASTATVGNELRGSFRS